ncbi:hypothetical protein CFC21_087076 [Triticum aestivum]|uniref:F-box/LRR-repeat protein 15/At3g58940/PEG3-like LRR domain-containing protein n=2 Tax=Triticum aestivum TaxID=4565 RepID=A0A9R1IFJ7_WHEAT|nr:hypothetical protein CFC21_005689 [Triticum aestivum]KAF7083268.1 hypothetical protein CFC21_087076 [Triticum aestivum]
MRKKKAAATAPVPAAAKTRAVAAAVAEAKKKATAADVAKKKKTVPAAKKKKATAAPAAKKRASGGTDGCRPRKRARDDNCDGDLISNLPEAVLCTIISLLPTKDGARTQAIARRWRPLWRSAPLNIDAQNLRTGRSLPLRCKKKNLSTNNFQPSCRCRGPRPPTDSIVSRILSDHLGPARCFDFRLTCICPKKEGHAQKIAQIESWFHSRSPHNLQELHIFFPILCRAARYSLPSSVLRFASTVVVATIGHCDVPKEIAPLLNFPLLKHLTLRSVSMSEDVFPRAISSCHVLETLYLQGNAYSGPSTLARQLLGASPSVIVMLANKNWLLRTPLAFKGCFVHAQIV